MNTYENHLGCKEFGLHGVLECPGEVKGKEKVLRSNKAEYRFIPGHFRMETSEVKFLLMMK